MSAAIQGAKRFININGLPLEGKITNFYYYESLLSPYVTANFTYIDTGNSISANKEDDPQNRLGTIRSALPLRGGELVDFKFRTSLGDLIYKKNKLVVDGSVLLSQESQREGVLVKLLSPLYVENMKTRVQEKFYNNTADSVRKIITQHLKVGPDRLDIDSTKTSYAFNGANRHPFDVLVDLASKSTPPEGDPGYFIFETKSGLHFKSIDNLIKRGPKPNIPTYTYNAAFTSDRRNDSNAYRILTPPDKRDQSISESLRAGMYSASFIYMHPKESSWKTVSYKLDDKKQSTLGRPVSFNPTLADKPSRIYNLVIPEGMMDQGISDNKNNNPVDYLARAVMRYNLLFVQSMNILIPCNPNLEAGDVIRCEFEKVTVDSKVQGSFDIPSSGDYLILNLCHYYGTTESYTSLTLVRDTYGNKGVVG